MSAMNVLESLSMNEERYVGLLTRLIGESKFLQNSPAQGLIPQEDLAARHICSFVGSHMDVVPADPSGWERDPFKLIREGDLLYGRGTTDCLGHVALLTEFMATLSEKRIGVDQLDKEGYMNSLKAGPLFWIDSADSQPCIGTAGVVNWAIKCKGKLFHSGLPHKGINSIELCTDVLNYIQKNTMKPCQINCTPGALNQLPPEATIEGDIRLTPFYDIKEVQKTIEGWVAELNSDLSLLYEFGHHGNHSRYELPDEDRKATVEISWMGLGENGIACSLDSPGNKALQAATASVLDLQDSGYDVQIAGYGFSSRYHADNECVSLKNMQDAFKIVSKVVSILEES
eukprot:GSChrysophyteH1.ASY1.ANO1.622.1 assembled CDS